MINRTDFAGISGTVTTSAGAKADDSELGFEELLTEKVSDIESGDNAFTEEVMEHMLRSIASMHDGSESIWEIVLRLEKHVDPKQLEEIIDMDFDNAAGLNGIAGLLARFRKKRELLGENDTVFSYSFSHNEIDNRASSELAALLKKKSTSLLRRFTNDMPASVLI